MNRRLFLILAAGATLAACTAGPTRMVPPPGAGFEELEPLYAVSAGREALTISVSSSGCTRKEDFAFFVERRSGAVSLSFGRRRLDTCQSFAMGRTDLTFSYAELGVAPNSRFFVMNPLAAWTGPGS
jgi:hypothetical protein